jgi:hypothetical protein
MKNSWFTRIWRVTNRGIPTPYTHVQLGHVDIIFKQDKVIGVETPTECYRSESYDSGAGLVAFTMDDSRVWTATHKKYEFTSEEGVVMHLNRLLKEQGEQYVSSHLKRKLVGN